MKKKICFVNCSATGSTGNIIRNIIKGLETFDFCCILGEKTAWINKSHVLSIGSTPLSYKICRTETFLFGNDGFLSIHYKNKILRFLKKEKPDIIHIHNPHRSFCNLEAIFKFSLKNNIKIVWTLHDLWAFTGRCCTPLECEGWLKGCGHCVHKNYFPRVVFDQSSKFYNKKTKLYNMLSESITFVAPSEWMYRQVDRRLQNFKKVIVNNGIDTNIFKPSIGNQEILRCAKNRFVIGAAALYFNELKGKSAFINMAKSLDKDKYFFVLIGTENKEISFLEENIMFLPKTFSQGEMAAFYNSLNVFVNPTQTDNFPTTHLESIACGTPVITYDVGGAKEMIVEGETGFAVSLNDVSAIVEKINLISNNKEKFDRYKVSSVSDFSLLKFCNQYKDLYLSSLRKITIK